MSSAQESKSPARVRIIIPAEDEVALKFLQAQGRDRSIPLRQLMHLFVAEYGYVDVASVLGGKIVGATPANRPDPAPRPDSAPKAKTKAKAEERVEEPEGPEVAEAKTKPEPKTKTKASSKPAPIEVDDDDLDMDALMSDARRG